MNKPTRSNASVFALVFTVALLTGCATARGVIGDSDSAESANESARSSSNLPENEDRSEADLNLILTEGYSQLYEAAKALKFLDDALILKRETDDFQTMAEASSEYFAKLETQLEELDKNYPSLSLDNNGLPVLEKKKRAAAAKDRLTSLSPLTGLTGIELERTLLLTLSGTFNQLRFLAIVMQEEEKAEERIAFLKDIEENFARLYQQDVDLLEAKYFVN